MTPDDSPATPASSARSIRASIAKGYRVRLLILTLGLCGFGIYALYDGIYAWPKERAIYLDHQDFKEKHDDWQSRWQDYALEQGYGTKFARNPNAIDSRGGYDIPSQYAMAAVCLPIGLWFAWCWFAAGRRYVEADEQGVRTNGGVDVPWDQVQAIEDDRWKAKGIAYLKHADKAGGEQRILLDDWKFNREETTAIYKLAQAKVSPADPATPEQPEPPTTPDEQG